MLEMLWKFVSKQFMRWTLRFSWKIWGFTLKKLKLGWDLGKKLKHEIKVDNNQWWLIPVSILYDNLYWNKLSFYYYYYYYFKYCTRKLYITEIKWNLVQLL